MRRILIISSPHIARPLAARLKQDGYQVQCHAESTVDGFRLTERLRPALILIDQDWDAAYDGTQFIYVLRNTPELANLRVVLMANKNSWFDTLAYLRSFAFQPDGYLLKPFGFEQAAGVVARLL